MTCYDRSVSKFSLSRLFSLLLEYLEATVHPQDVITIFRRLFLQFTPSPGTYEVLEHEVTLELKDAKGKKAIYRKHQKVRFTQDGVIAVG